MTDRWPFSDSRCEAVPIIFLIANGKNETSSTANSVIALVTGKRLNRCHCELLRMLGPAVIPSAEDKDRVNCLGKNEDEGHMRGHGIGSLMHDAGEKSHHKLGRPFHVGDTHIVYATQ